jgi:ActR/RegA family two-component response regulator
MAESRGSLLFVDDEPSIRLTLPPVLQKAGFDVRIAENVPQALYEINSRKFDAVITDLNIGEEGDGFLVTSAMRHVQPQCLTFILTGYPAFETALQAIHNRVDDYLVKPVDIDVLTKVLKEKLQSRASTMPPSANQLTSALRREAAQIIRTAAGKGNGSCSQKELTELFTEVIDYLESASAVPGAPLLQAAREYGKSQLRAGYTPSAQAQQIRAIEQDSYTVLEKAQ